VAYPSECEAWLAWLEHLIEAGAKLITSGEESLFQFPTSDPVITQLWGFTEDLL
jgi:hypothetical protein